MSFFDRDRLIIAVLVSVVVHGGVFALISMADFETSVPEFSGPVYVELPEVVETQFPPEERPEEEQREPEERPEDAVAAEPEEPEEAEAPPEEPAESSQQMQPEAAQPERAQPQQQAPPEQEAPEPEAQPRAQRAPEPAQADVPETAPAESDAQETRPQREAQPEPVDPLARHRDEPVEVSDAELYGRSPQPRRDREAPEEPEGFLPPDTGEPERELPVWVQDIMDGTDISTTDMSREEATRLAEKIRTDPALQRQLESVVSAVEAARTDRERSPESTPSTDEDHEDRTPSEAAPGADTPGPETPGDAQRQEGPEGSQLRFLGDGTGALRPVDPFPQDLLSAGDFPGVVPAELTFVIVFEIDPSGIVVPGSVIFQQKSSYTVVNEKIRRAVLNWGFTPHGGDEPVTAIFTPIVRREDVRS
ncbi:MAG: hypothetical protein ACOCYG_07195 [Spirochaetota bacterium]